MHDGHSHELGHGHDHDHDHNHENASGISQKDLALLKYMLEHNRQHAEELISTGKKIKTAGSDEAAKKIDDAVHYFEHANEELEKAISLLD